MKSLLKKILPKAVIHKYHYFWAFVSVIFCGFPSKKIKVIGVTGTNGKSTVVYLLAQMFKEAGYRVALSSSIEFWVGDKVWSNMFKMTMPGRFFIQKFLKQAVDAKCDYAIIEVTSEGILQSRHAFIDFDAAVLTNISLEHIERHGGYENYKKAKGKLFEALNSSSKKDKTAIINIADKEANYFLSLLHNVKTTTFRRSDQVPTVKAFSGTTEIISTNERMSKKGISFDVNDIEFKSDLRGVFNIENLLTVIAVGISQNIALERMSNILRKCNYIPGRLEKIDNRSNIDIYIDYAHTPAALKSVYQALAPNSELICVLGAAGGGRDRWKRPELGKIAAQYCKEIILTNEDPYDESPRAIIDAIAEGVKETRNDYEIIIDRKEAITKAINMADSSETVIITGKGSENLMMLGGGKKISWDDREIAKLLTKK